MHKKFVEFFEENGVGSMSRLVTFISAITIAVGTIICLLDNEYANAATFAGILAGLGGVGYGVNRMSAAYENTRASKENKDVE